MKEVKKRIVIEDEDKQGIRRKKNRSSQEYERKRKGK